uniref:Uncharacterized protein n=1 Tax=Oncorhynchus mykiss TaxID=8022 RepID=A0A8C7LXK7_ONCMY
MIIMGHWLWTSVVLAALIFECRGADGVTQSTREVTAYEGEDVSLNCAYNTSLSAPSLFWYIQYTNDYPEYVLRKDVIGPGDIDDRFKERFDAHLSSITKLVPLTIQRVQLSDSAVYYCALKPTVTTRYTAPLQKHLVHVGVYSTLCFFKSMEGVIHCSKK